MQLGKSQLRALLDASERGLALLDERAVVGYANATCARLAGREDAEPDVLVGREFAGLFPGLGDEIDWVKAASNAVQYGREVRLCGCR